MAGHGEVLVAGLARPRAARPLVAAAVQVRLVLDGVGAGPVLQQRLETIILQTSIMEMEMMKILQLQGTALGRRDLIS